MFIRFCLMFFSFSLIASSPLSYREDGVVVTGELLSPFKGETIDKLSLMKWEKEGFIAVPFQIDEKTPKGEFVLPNGKEKNPQAGNLKLDTFDELVFMAKDSGELAPKDAQMPKGATRGLEIVVEDVKENKKSAVYLFSFSSEPPRCDVDYAKHLVEDGRNYVKTSRYWFGEPVGTGYFDRLHLIGSAGKVGRNLVDRIKGRGHINAFRGAIDFGVPEEKTAVDLVAWKDGQVRVIRRMRGGVDLLGLKIKLAGGADNIFYENYFYTPINFNLPVNPKAILAGSSMIYTIDFNQYFKGSTYFDAVNQEITVLDGVMDEKEKNLDRKTNHNWYAVSGKEGSLVVRMIIPKKWEGFVNMVTFYEDDDKAKDPPESEPGRHQVGFHLSGMFEVPAGNYKYYLYYMVPLKPILKPEDVKPWLEIIDNPLKLSSTIFK